MRFKQEHDKRFKLRPEQRVEIKDLFSKGYTNKRLSEMFKVSTSTITCITRDKPSNKPRDWRKYYKREQHTQVVRDINARKRALGYQI